MKMMLLRLILATTLLAAAHPLPATPVTFWFTGTVEATNNPGGSLPANITPGTPFYGRISYDIANLTFSNLTTFTNGTVANYYFRSTPGFAFLLQIGGHTVTNQEIKNFQWAGNITVHNNYNNSDQFSADIGSNGLVTDGQADTNSLCVFYVSDYSQAAFNSSALPAQPPVLALFNDVREFGWYQFNEAQNLRFHIRGLLTEITTNPLVALNLRRALGENVQVAWPSVVAGGALETATDITATNWQNVATPGVDIGMEHAVTVPADATAQFFRLKFP
jgi:hypothetical protein